MVMNKKEKAELEAAHKAVQEAQDLVHLRWPEQPKPTPLTKEEIERLIGAQSVDGSRHANYCELATGEKCLIVFFVTYYGNVSRGVANGSKYNDKEITRPSKWINFTGPICFLTEADAWLYLRWCAAEEARGKLADLCGRYLIAVKGGTAIK